MDIKQSSNNQHEIDCSSAEISVNQKTYVLQIMENKIEK